MQTATLKIKRGDALYEITVENKSSVVVAQTIISLGRQVQAALDNNLAVEKISLPQQIARHYIAHEELDPQYEEMRYIEELEACRTADDVIALNKEYRLFRRFPDYDMTKAASALQNARVRLRMVSYDLESLRAEVMCAINSGVIDEEAFLKISKGKPPCQAFRGELRFALKMKCKRDGERPVTVRDVENQERQDEDILKASAKAAAIQD